MRSVASAMAALFIVSLLIVFLQRGIRDPSSECHRYRRTAWHFQAGIHSLRLQQQTWSEIRWLGPVPVTLVTLPCAHSSALSLPSSCSQAGEHGGFVKSSHQVPSCTFEAGAVLVWNSTLQPRALVERSHLFKQQRIPKKLMGSME